MTRLRIYVLLATACAAVGLVFLSHLRAQTAGPATAAEARVAVCDIQEVFNEYVRAKDLATQLRDKRQAMVGEDEQRGQAIDALQVELDGLKPGSAEHETRRAEADRLRIDRAAAMQYNEMALRREHCQLTIEMYAEVNKALAAVAQEKGFNLVLYRDGNLVETDQPLDLMAQVANRKLLYSDDSLDITADVLARLNESYRSSAR